MINTGIFPIFDSKFLMELTKAIKKRSKSIKNNTISYNVQKVIEISGENSSEKLEMEFLLIRKISVKIYLWEDRWAWIDVRSSTKNKWLFELQSEGRIGSTDPTDIEKALESTLEYALTYDKNKLEKIWSHIILKGPR